MQHEEDGMKILIFGNLASGKSYIAGKIKEMLPHLEYLSIDDFRRQFGDGTKEKEQMAKQMFFNGIQHNKPQLIEATGLGDTGVTIAEALQETDELKFIIILKTSLEVCLERLKTRTWDIPADMEIEENPYTNQFVKGKAIHAPFDPCDQSDYFKANYNQGSNSEIAYRFFAIECKESVKIIVKGIIEQTNNAIAIHCVAGKDRTGCVIALLYLLCGATEEELYLDYFASESDTKKYKIDTFLAEVKKYASIEDYFISCGLPVEEINALKERILR
jgi:adenylate kinase family enzyme